MDIKDYLRNVTVVELEKVCVLAGTTMGYMKLLKGGWASPSLRLRERFITAAIEVTPDRVPDFANYPTRKINNADL